MISALCLNPSIDRTVEIDEFSYGGMNRIRQSRSDGSGKGVNVAIVARTLGLEAHCIGFLYRENGQPVQQRLEKAGCETDFIWLDGAVRVNTKVVDRKSGAVTELNEAGVPVSRAQLDDMRHLFNLYARRSDLLVLTGSVPPGCPPEIYRVLIEGMGDPGKIVLDAEGARLAEGLKAKPYMVKPNRFELETAVGRKLGSLGEIAAAAQGWIDQGIGIVAVSLGAEGALITDGQKRLFAPRIPVQVRSTVGAGDSMIGGFLYGLENRMGLADVFRYGVAAGTAACVTAGTQLVDRKDFQNLLDRVQIQAV